VLPTSSSYGDIFSLTVQYPIYIKNERGKETNQGQGTQTKQTVPSVALARNYSDTPM